MKSISIAAVLILFSLPAFAQDAADPSQRFANRDGTFGLLFSVNELKLDSFKGGLGLKYWLSDMWALGGTVTLERDERTVEFDTREDQDILTSTGLSVAVERHLGRSRLTPYVGGGIGYDYTRDTSTSADTSSTSERTLTNHRVSASLNFGVEFWITQHFTLAGQYGLVGAYTSAKAVQSQTNATTRESTSNNTQIGMGAGALVLAVYF